MSKDKGSIIQAILGSDASKSDIERAIAKLILGHVLAVKALSKPTEEIEQLFQVRDYEAIRQARLHKDIREAFEWGMEIRDVIRHTPKGLTQSLDAIHRLTKRYLLASFAKRRKSAASATTKVA